MNQEKLCGNCKHFTQHYVKSAMCYRITNFGHCFKRATSRAKNIIPSAEPCNFWEPIELKIDDSKNSIIKCLLKMAKRVEDIYAILISDEVSFNK